jgi:1-acyl-sn-glycerol-3-phosphate acyltransferase
MTEHLLTVENLPSRLQRCAVRILAWFGWHVHFAPLPGPRGVIIFYPHTSNWDFAVGVLARWAVGVPIRWLGKESLFTGVSGLLFGRMLRRLGGEPIERQASTGAIERLGQRIQSADWYWLALAPEGTRKYRANWRSGFYHIAMAADVPLALAYIDYSTRTVGVVNHMQLSGDVGRDLEQIRAAYAGRQGYRAEMAAPITLQGKDTQSPT